MPPKKTAATASRAATAKRAAAEASSAAAESARMDAKADRIQAALAEHRRREAELTKQGYCF